MEFGVKIGDIMTRNFVSARPHIFIPEAIKLMAKEKSTKAGQQPKLRIKLKSYDIKMLEASLGKVVNLLSKSGAEIVGPVPLPRKRKLYTVLKSNFVYKDAREQFERWTYTRLIDVVET